LLDLLVDRKSSLNRDRDPIFDGNFMVVAGIFLAPHTKRKVPVINEGDGRLTFIFFVEHASPLDRLVGGLSFSPFDSKRLEWRIQLVSFEAH
jgi:hypothetical protein